MGIRKGINTTVKTTYQECGMHCIRRPNDHQVKGKTEHVSLSYSILTKQKNNHSETRNLHGGRASWLPGSSYKVCGKSPQISVSPCLYMTVKCCGKGSPWLHGKVFSFECVCCIVEDINYLKILWKGSNATLYRCYVTLEKIVVTTLL